MAIADHQSSEFAAAAEQLKIAFDIHLWDKKKSSYSAGNLENDSLNRKSIMGRITKGNVLNGKV